MIIKLYCCENTNPVGIIKPVFSWKVIGCKEKKQIAYRIKIYTSDNKTVWDSGRVNSCASSYIKPNVSDLRENTKYLWKVDVYTEKSVHESKTAYFITGLLNIENIMWIAADKRINSPIIFKEFNLNKTSEYAVANVCGLGFFELYINGNKISRDLLCPVRTDYDAVVYKNLKYPYNNETRKSVQYLSYEVSEYLKTGKNTVCVWLGNGWYRQHGRTVEGLFDYGDELKMFFCLTNGDERIESDESWEWTESPIVYDNIFLGEVCRGQVNFNRLYYRENVHKSAVPVGKIIPQLCPSERVVEEYCPKYIGCGVYDAAVCLSGFAQITCIGKPGDEVLIYYAESIDESGGLDFTSTVGYEESDKKQIQKDKYIIQSYEAETYTPKFTWHSFRYFKIFTSNKVKIKNVKVLYVCSDLKLRSSFDCSNGTLNKLHNLCLNTSLSNTHGCVPMDCSHRERLGYTGDGQLSSLTMMYNFDAYHMYLKWIDDIIDSQNLDTGFVPHTAPFNGGGGGPAWGSAIAVVPWNLYLQYGDKEVIERSRPAIKMWIKYLSLRKEKGLIVREEDGSWCLGDWCMPSEFPWSEPRPAMIKIPPELVNTVCYINCIDIYIKICALLDKAAEHWIIEERESAAKALYGRFKEKGAVSGEQGEVLFLLFADNIFQKEEQELLDTVIKKIQKNNYRFDTGIIGTSYLFYVLDKFGRNDIAIKMLLCNEYPSYGHFLKNGATALWETWEGNGAKNHTAFSSFDSWLFYGLAGIKPNKNGGYRGFFIKPYFAEELSKLKVSLECEYGEIVLLWERKKNGIKVKINIPFNTFAKVDLKGKHLTLDSGEYEYLIN